MFIIQAGQPPVSIHWKDKELELVIPKFILDKIIEWSRDIMEQRQQEIASGMTDMQYAEHRALYPPLPPDMLEMKRMVRTPEGAKYVVAECLKFAKVVDTKEAKHVEREALKEEEIKEFLETVPGGTLTALGWVLADVEEILIPARKPEDKEKPQNPTTKREKPESKD
jgi:hypothetical protein